MRDLKEIERRQLSTGGGVDEHVKIAVCTGIATRPRSKQREPGHARGFERRSKLAQPGEDFFEGDVGDVVHGRIRLYHYWSSSSPSGRRNPPFRAGVTADHAAPIHPTLAVLTPSRLLKTPMDKSSRSVTQWGDF